VKKNVTKFNAMDRGGLGLIEILGYGDRGSGGFWCWFFGGFGVTLI
jgi:hypothetical protein